MYSAYTKRKTIYGTVMRRDYQNTPLFMLLELYGVDFRLVRNVFRLMQY